MPADTQGTDMPADNVSREDTPENDVLADNASSRFHSSRDATSVYSCRPKSLRSLSLAQFVAEYGKVFCDDPDDQVDCWDGPMLSLTGWKRKHWGVRKYRSQPAAVVLKGAPLSGLEGRKQYAKKPTLAWELYYNNRPAQLALLDIHQLSERYGVVSIISGTSALGDDSLPRDESCWVGPPLPFANEFFPDLALRKLSRPNTTTPMSSSERSRVCRSRHLDSPEGRAKTRAAKEKSVKATASRRSRLAETAEGQEKLRLETEKNSKARAAKRAKSALAEGRVPKRKKTQTKTTTEKPKRKKRKKGPPKPARGSFKPHNTLGD
jgi:hypothetical protein